MKLCTVISLAAFSVTVAGCDSVSFHSNLDPDNFIEYAKPASVEIYDAKSILERDYASLGHVTGLACQEKPEDYIALPEDARTDARIKAANLGANGIVFSKCIRLEKTNACVVSVTCYGEAVRVKDEAKRSQAESQGPESADEDGSER